MGASILSMVFSKYWLFTSGLIYMDSSPYYISMISCFAFFCIIMGYVMCYLTKSFKFFWAGSFLSLIMAMIGYVKGLSWLVNPESFLSNLSSFWKSSVNTAYVVPIEHKFKCCGFKMINEYLNDACKSSDKNPCFRVLNQHFSSNIQSNGVFLLIQSGSHSFLIAFFFIEAQKITKKLTEFSPMRQLKRSG